MILRPYREIRRLKAQMHEFDRTQIRITTNNEAVLYQATLTLIMLTLRYGQTPFTFSCKEEINVEIYRR
jgi:hypothetical protein